MPGLTNKMTTFLAKRLFSLLVTLLVASLIIFLLLEILPGDPALIILGVGAQEDTLAALRTEMGLDLSAPERYFRWIIGILQGDFGRSYTYDTPVSELILERLSLSLPLALLAISLSTLLAIPFGVFAAANHKRFADTGIMGFAQLGVAVPNFWFAILLILFFSVKLGWFSAGGFAGWEMGFGAALKSLVLPAVASGTAASRNFSASYTFGSFGNRERRFCTHRPCKRTQQKCCAVEACSQKCFDSSCYDPWVTTFIFAGGYNHH